MFQLLCCKALEQEDTSWVFPSFCNRHSGNYIFVSVVCSILTTVVWLVPTVPREWLLQNMIALLPCWWAVCYWHWLGIESKQWATTIHLNLHQLSERFITSALLVKNHLLISNLVYSWPAEVLLILCQNSLLNKILSFPLSLLTSIDSNPILSQLLL